MPYLHLPVQSGSDRVLDAMNRRHTHDVYLRILDRLARRVPTSHSRVTSSSAFRVKATAILPIRWRLSTRSDTPRPILSNTARVPARPAAASEEQVPEAVKSERLEALQQLLNAQQFAFNKATEGQVMDVLIERRGGRDGQVGGRSPTCSRSISRPGRTCRQDFVLPDCRGETELNHRGGRMTGSAW